MSSASVIGAVIERVGGFTFAPAVTVWFDQAPLKDTGGNAVSVPYVVVHDDGTVPEFDFEYNPLETTSLRFEVYGLSLATVDAIVNTIRYGGGSLTAGAGMDFAASLPLTGSTLRESVRVSEQRFQEASRGGDGVLVFRCRLVYRVVALRTSA